MPSTQRRSPPHQPSAARERIAAKRAARRARSLSPVTMVVIGVGVVAVVLLGLLLLRFQTTLGSIQQNDPRRVLAANTTQAGGLASVQSAAGDALNKPYNVLLIGVDKRPNPADGVRSDTLIVVHVEPQAKWASLLSIPRDSIVTIPKFGQAKINTAYSDGYANAEDLYGTGTTPDAAGGALAAQTIEQFLGINIAYVAEVDFAGFAQLVDAVGGVQIDVAQTLIDDEYPTEDYGVERIVIPAGRQLMDGATALKYARSRHSTDDFDRSKRQQQVLRALLAQVKARGLLETIGNINQYTDVLAKNVRTTLPLRDPGAIASLVGLARELTPERIVQLSINPNDVQVTVNGSDLYWNQADIEAVLARWQAGPQAVQLTATAEPAPRIQIINAAGVEGLATRMTTALRGKGYTLLDPSTGTQPLATTRIIDYTNRAEAASQLAQALGLPAAAVQAPDAAAPSAAGADLVLLVGQDYRQEWLGP